MLSDTVRAIQRVCFASEPSEADLDLLGSRERWLIYRDLVRTRLTGVIEAALPRTKVATGESTFRSVIDEWLSAGGPKTRYFRNVPTELAAFAIPVWGETSSPWIADLARYEIACWSVRHAPPDPVPEADFAFETRPLVGTAVRVLRLNHRVHEAPTPDDGYVRDAVILCIHRNEGHRAIAQVLNPLAADLLEAWQRSGQTVAESVERIAADHGTEIGPAFVDKLSTLITSFITQGILVGGHAPPP